MAVIIDPKTAHLIFQHGFAAYEAWVAHRTLHTVSKLADSIRARDRTTLRQGFEHLIDAASSGAEGSKAIALGAAYSCFSEIRTVADASNSGEFFALGQLGNHAYFTAVGDRQNALRCVYDCTAKYPDIALSIFPHQFFARDYKRLNEEARREVKHLETSLALAEVEIQSDLEQRRARHQQLGMPSRYTMDLYQEAKKVKRELKAAEERRKSLETELAAECRRNLADLTKPLPDFTDNVLLRQLIGRK
jgi:hypothetical protein